MNRKPKFLFAKTKIQTQLTSTAKKCQQIKDSMEFQSRSNRICCAAWTQMRQTDSSRTGITKGHPGSCFPFIKQFLRSHFSQSLEKCSARGNTAELN